MMINMLTTFFRPIKHRQSYVHLLYLLVAFLLGCCYLFFLVIGFSFSMLPVPILIGALLNVKTVPIWIVIPSVLFLLLEIVLVLSVIQKLAAFERSMAQAWLKVTIPDPFLVEREKTGRWKRLVSSLKSAVMWKSLTYFLVKAFFGPLSLGIVLSILGLSFLLFFGSLAIVIAMGLAFLFHTQPFPLVALIPFAGLNSLPVPLVLVRLGFTALLGPVLFAGDVHLSNGLAVLWGQFAARTLGASQSDLQLAEARRLAERERARADQADQKRRELITNVSHELRTPVTSIQGHVESLLKACGSDGTTLSSPDLLRTYLTIVHRESLHLGTLVDDLLALSRAETNELRLKLEAVAAEEVIEEVYQTVMPLARRERQIALVHQIEPALPPVLADRQRLTQVLLNLVRNAITYTPDGGIVSISLHKADDEHLALLVSDTGMGIPPEEQERIFERFYRTDTSRSRRSGGAGLGLAIVRDFVVAMGGSISVESMVGEGSTFRVLLQVAQVSRS